MKLLRIASLSIALFALCACASVSAPDGLSTNARGMSKQQVQRCMGAPKLSSVEGNKEFLTYLYRNFYDRYTYQCTVTVELTADRVTKLTSQGDSIDVSDPMPEVCRRVLPKCMR